MTCLLFLDYEGQKFRLVFNWGNPRTCWSKTSDRNCAMTSARLDSLEKGQAALPEAVERIDADLIELKEGQKRLRDVMERGFDRIEDILRERDTPE